MNLPVQPALSSELQVLIIIVNYKTANLTIACLESLRQEIDLNPATRVFVIENDSGDSELIDFAIKDRNWSGWVTLIVANRNGGFSFGNNLGIKEAMSMPKPPEYFVLLNPDTQVRTGAIRILTDYMIRHPKVGIAGSSFENENGEEWPIAFRFPTILSELEQGMRLGLVSKLLRKSVVARQMGKEPDRVDWLSGACMMIRRQVFEDAGMMDEGYFLYFEEVDFCLQAQKAGWECWYVPQSQVMHIFGASTGASGPAAASRRMPDYWYASRRRYFVKNHGVIYAFFADLAFFIGLAIRTVRLKLLPNHRDEQPKMLRDFLRTSIPFLNNRGSRRKAERN